METAEEIDDTNIFAPISIDKKEFESVSKPKYSKYQNDENEENDDNVENLDGEQSNDLEDAWAYEDSDSELDNNFGDDEADGADEKEDDNEKYETSYLSSLQNKLQDSNIDESNVKNKNNENTNTTANNNNLYLSLYNRKKNLKKYIEDLQSESESGKEDMNEIIKSMCPDVDNLADLTDSSNDSDGGPLLRNGNVPIEWYEKELHDGYDIDGNKVKLRGEGDFIDQFLKSRDKNTLKRSIYDRENDRIVTLNDRDLGIINRIRKGQSASIMYDPGIPEPTIFDITTNGIEPKSRFTISSSDLKKILYYKDRIRKGLLNVNNKGEAIQPNKNNKPGHIKIKDKIYDIWGDAYKTSARRNYLAPPKERLPGHNESYNPPAEYLLSQEQQKRVLALPFEQRRGRLIPHKYDAMRKVPLYERFIHERFERCLDLYLCPRMIRTRRVVNPNDLLPKLPDINTLRPFPEILSIEYTGHSAMVRSISISPCGTWIASGSDDGTVRIWEIDTGREYWRHSFSDEYQNTENGVECVSFNPNIHYPLLAVVFKHRCILIPLNMTGSKSDYAMNVMSYINEYKHNKSIKKYGLKDTIKLFSQNLLDELKHWPQLIDDIQSHQKGYQIPNAFKSIVATIERNNKDTAKNKETKENKNTKKNIKNDNDDDEDDEDDEDENKEKNGIDDSDEVKLNTNDVSVASQWCIITLHNHSKNTIYHSNKLYTHAICINHIHYLNGIKWHSKGDYFATYHSMKYSSSVIIHRFTQKKSQIPFTKPFGEIQDILFHPRKALIYIATKSYIRCFNLLTCRLKEKYITTMNWITSFDLHISGLNIVAGGMDGRVCWYDMDLSRKPFKTFKFHNQCVRKVKYSKTYNLWATCSDDGKIYIFYCKMFRDVLADPILIPCKIIKIKNHRILNIDFHPTQPWLFASSSDGVIRLYTAL